MQASQPITAVGGYTESHSRHAPSNRAFKSETKIRLRKNAFYFYIMTIFDLKKHTNIIRATQEATQGTFKNELL